MNLFKYLLPEKIFPYRAEFKGTGEQFGNIFYNAFLAFEEMKNTMSVDDAKEILILCRDGVLGLNSPRVIAAANCIGHEEAKRIIFLPKPKEDAMGLRLPGSFESASR
jgi:hypothetical protein